jgi:uncharacterized protein YkwD
MTVAVQATERRAPRRRVVWAVLLGVLPLVIAGSAMVGAAAQPSSHAEAAPGSAAGEEVAPEEVAGQAVIAGVTAPGTLEGLDVSASIQQITVKFPPPPEPVSPASGSSGGEGSSGSSGSSSMSHAKWCANNSAKYSASSASSMLTAINKERARNGAPALKASSSLAQKAKAWSEEMAESGAFKHSTSPGAAENLFWMSSGSSWSLAHTSLMKSDGHCANIMNPDLKAFGVGVATGDSGWYLTQRFGR